MGTRAQVKVASENGDSEIYLYQHYDGYDLIESVRRAIHKQWRWDDPEYLTRIIFDEMTKDSHGEETGFGIGVRQHGDIEFLVTVDCDKKTVTNLNLNTNKKKTWTFEDMAKERY